MMTVIYIGSGIVLLNALLIVALEVRARRREREDHEQALRRLEESA
jgi:hypothetical protein